MVVDFGQNVVGLFADQLYKLRERLLRGPAGHQTGLFRDAAVFKATEVSDITSVGQRGWVQNNAQTWRNQLGCLHDGKVCSDGLHGFRYAKIWLDALASDAPYTPDTFTGWFECSDKDLTQWWYDGVYTVDVGTGLFMANETEPRGTANPTLQGKKVLFDGAKRGDRDPYMGYMAVASLTSYLSHNFSEPSLNVLEDLAQHQRSDDWTPPCEHVSLSLQLTHIRCTDSLAWYEIADDQNRNGYTGSMVYGNSYWNTMKRVLDNYYVQYIDKDTGLLVKAAEMGYGDYAFLPRSGPITYYNALYVACPASQAASISAALWRRTNLDPQKQAAPSTTAVLGPASPWEPTCDVHSQDGNALAITVE
ncbi:hypothetical protein V2A60_002674 [Cordyceps javanica]